jgi:hypothetical protein
MATLLINDEDAQARNFLNYALTLPFVSLAQKDESPCRYSAEELEQRALQGIQSYKNGNVTSHEEMKKRYTAV